MRVKNIVLYLTNAVTVCDAATKAGLFDYKPGVETKFIEQFILDHVYTSRSR